MKDKKKRADGRYRSKVTLPSGKVKYVYGYTKKELKQKREDVLLQYALGITDPDNKTTVQEWGTKWWNAVKKGKTGRSSQRVYLTTLNNYIFENIGGMKLADVRLVHIQDMINDMGELGRSESLQRKVLVTANAMFIYAMRNGLIASNPAQFAEIYTVDNEAVTALTREQVAKLLKLCAEWPRKKNSTRADRAELAIHMGLYLGLRRGEIVAAQWGDIDKKNQTFYVTRAAELVRNQPENKGPKSVAGARHIPISDPLFARLENTKKTSIYIVPSHKGKQLTQTGFRCMIEPIQQELDFKFTMHMLRHTYATLLEEMGVSPKMCQYLLGHATESTTKKIYTHIQPEYVQATGEQIRDIVAFSQKQGVRKGSNAKSQ